MDRKYKFIIHRHKHRLFRLNHVVGVGYGKKEKGGRLTDEDAIIVMVDQKLPLQKLKQQDLVPAIIENAKTDVIEIGKIQFQNRTAKERPAKPGVSIGHYNITAGTFGAVVRDNKTGAPLILSNNHVLANQSNGFDGRAKKGDPILQPGAYDKGKVPDDVIATLERFAPVRTSIESASCPVARGLELFINDLLHVFRPDYSFKLFKQDISNTVDCAVAKPISSDYVNNEIIGIGEIRGIKEPEIGMTVYKSGRTTGLTKGIIKAIHSTVEVSMDSGEVALFEDQIIAEAMSKPGDSGSLVVDKKQYAVGLLFAGSNEATVINRISNVLQALDVSF